MKVKVCKNCAHWHRRGGVMTSGECGLNDMMLTLDQMHCSGFAYHPSADAYQGHSNNGGGGDDDGPVDITPRGPGGNRLVHKQAMADFQSFQSDWAKSVSKSGHLARLPYDPDGDKKD